MDYITGSKGFIGTHLTKRLDNFVPISHEKIRSTDFSEADRIFFLSAYGNMHDHYDSQKIIQANVLDLCHVLESVDWTKLKSFIFISTSSVKLKVQTMYSRTKKASEEILLSFIEKHSYPITIIRPTSVTGVGEQKEHLIPKLIDSCMTNKRMNFVPDPTHDFIDVEDVVDGILSLSNNRSRGVYELGTGKSYTNQEILEMVEKETQNTANVNVVGSMRTYDNDNWIATNFKSRGWGWYPKKTVEQSIKEMVEDYASK